MKTITFLTFALLLSSAAYAAHCPHDQAGDLKSVMLEASGELQGSHPELASKLGNIAGQCCALDLHRVPPFTTGKPGVDPSVPQR